MNKTEKKIQSIEKKINEMRKMQNKQLILLDNIIELLKIYSKMILGDKEPDQEMTERESYIF